MADLVRTRLVTAGGAEMWASSSAVMGEMEATTVTVVKARAAAVAISACSSVITRSVSAAGIVTGAKPAAGISAVKQRKGGKPMEVAATILMTLE